MRTAYKVLAYLVAAEVAVQAMVMVWAIAGLSKWVDGGGVFDKAVIESQGTPFPEVAGILVHGINGMMIIPLLGIVLLVISFFVKFDGAVKWAAIVLAAIVVQVFAGIFGPDAPYIGLIHGLNAFILAGSAGFASRQAKAAETGAPATTVPA